MRTQRKGWPFSANCRFGAHANHLLARDSGAAAEPTWDEDAL